MPFLLLCLFSVYVFLCPPVVGLSFYFFSIASLAGCCTISLVFFLSFHCLSY
ncbi:hypothetical protein NC652_004036 [Populus alba x Populus x berolinensis]|nr:hypothetical protein NC652_004036 [Populus alba x Populus x berolinensis]